MKTCTRLHFEDIERGDRILLAEGSVQEFNTERDPDVTVTVQRIYRTHNFGWVIKAEDGETYYLNDYDRIEWVQ